MFSGNINSNIYIKLIRMAEAEPKPKQTIVVTYRPSPRFRVIKVDGAWGGATPRLDIQMAVYSERLAIPDFEELDISGDGPLKSIRIEHTTTGPIREVEAMLSMSVPVARSLAMWLTEKADSLEKALQEAMTKDAEVKIEEPVNNDK